MASSTREEIRAGVRDTWVVGLGLIPLGMAFGLLMTQAGFAWWWTPIFSFIIYAGSMEFLAIGLVLSATGPLSAAVTGLMVNFRHIFYGLTFPRDLISSKLGRAYATYSLTDEGYAIASTTRPRSGARVLTILAACQALWVLPGIAGALLGHAVPDSIQGVEFALTALFIVLAYEALASARDASAVILAAVLAVVATIIVPGNMLMVALLAYFGVMLARYHRPRLDAALRWEVK
ncbi:AzlC family ABC transporter permease [Corynebacterium sp. LK2510]|uniref:AzlC family ABC transporter permease n=1 Tax=Corynebacterium sp. LK2510 TaxID=3110472 RepID=UPI0034CF156D